MHELSTEHLLAAWERGLAEPHHIGRALALLGAASRDADPLSLAELTVGRRDAMLLQLHQELFGESVDALSVCTGCRERVEICFNLSEIQDSRPPISNNSLTLCFQQYEVEFRPPSSRDLLVLAGSGEDRLDRSRLLERIVLSAKHMDQVISIRELPDSLISAIESRIQEADPQAEVSLKLRCQSCGHEWSALFDIGSFLWKHVDAWAIRLLREVHTLARAYGWREADILAMTPWRRFAYLEMLGT
jgi:hypothetical protein